LRFSARGGRGNGVGLTATEDSSARLVSSRLTLGREGRAWAHCREEGGGRGRCDNTPSQPHPVGGKASQAASPGSPVGEYPPRKEAPKSTHALRRPGEDAPSDKHELCDRKFTCPRRRPRGNNHASPSYPVRSPQTLRKPPLRHPLGTLRKHSENPLSDTLKGTSENTPLRAHGASLSGGRPKLRTPP